MKKKQKEEKVGGKKKEKRERGLRELKWKTETEWVGERKRRGWRDRGSSGRRGERLDPDWKPNGSSSGSCWVSRWMFNSANHLCTETHMHTHTHTGALVAGVQFRPVDYCGGDVINNKKTVQFMYWIDWWCTVSVAMGGVLSLSCISGSDGQCRSPPASICWNAELCVSGIDTISDSSAVNRMSLQVHRFSFTFSVHQFLSLSCSITDAFGELLNPALVLQHPLQPVLSHEWILLISKMNLTIVLMCY